MELVVFTEETLPRTWGGIKSTIAKVQFGKAGTISFNRAAVELMELKPGDKVSLAQDKKQAENWYFFKDVKNGFALRGKDFEKTGSAVFNHAVLVKTFCDAWDLPGEASHSYLIAGQPTIIAGDKTKTKYWGIIITPQK